MQKKSVSSASGAARAAIRIGLSTLLRGCKFALAAVAMSLSAVCQGGIVIFPSTGYDLASAEDWGGTLPGTADIARFTSSKTVTASNDVEFAGLYVGKSGNNSTVVVFDMRDSVSGGSPRKITVNGNACVFDGDNNGNLWNTRYTLRGGVWDFGSKTVGINPPGKYYNPSGCSLTIDGGAVVTCWQLLGAQTASGRSASIRIDGEGTVVTSATWKVANYGGNQNTATVANGATVVLTGTGEDVLAVDYGNGNENRLVVTNGASVEKLDNNKKVIVGRQGRENRLEVHDGSAVTIASPLFFGHAGNADANSSSGNRIVVRGTGARLSLARNIYIGNANGVEASAGNSNNVISVLDGGTFSLGGFGDFYGHDNGVVISNATMTMAHKIVCQTSQNCFLRLQGTHPSFVSTANSNWYSEFKDGFRFCFDLPDEGYDGTVEWPYAMNNQAKFMDDTVSVEVTGIREVRARMKAEGIEAKTINLAKFTNGFATDYGITDAMLTRWNEALPEGTRLVLESSGSARLLKLTVKANAPTVVVWR